MLAQRFFLMILLIKLSMFSSFVSALGLGNVVVDSKLNQTLNARIQLLKVPEKDVDNIQVVLASAEAFRRAGLDRPYVLSTLKFTLDVRRGSPSAQINIHSQQPIKEPFLNFLIEVNWPNGRLLREYTILLDPPTYKVESTEPPAIASAQMEPFTKQATAVGDDHPVLATTKKSAKSARSGKKGRKRATADGRYTVASNDTLWAIAQQHKPAGVSHEQMMAAIFDANPQAFFAGNMNQLKKGESLILPSGTQANQLSQKQALNLFKTHHKTWRDYRQSSTGETQAKVTTVASKPASQESKMALGKAFRLSPPASDSDIGTATAETAASDNKQIKALQQQLKTLTESNQSLEQDNNRLHQEVKENKVLLEEMKAEMDKLIALQKGTLAQMVEQMNAQKAVAKQAKAAEAVTPKPTETAKPNPAIKTPDLAEVKKILADVADKPAQPAPDATQTPVEPAPELVDVDEPATEQPETAPVVQTPTESPVAIPEANNTEPPPSALQPIDSALVDTHVATDESQWLRQLNELVATVPFGWQGIAGSGVLVLSLILALLLKRKRKQQQEVEAEEMVKLEEIQAQWPQVEPSTPITKTTDEIDTDTDVDALLDSLGKWDKDEKSNVYENLDEEIDVLLSYSRQDEAIDMLNKALESEPENVDYRLRLLQLYANERKGDEFDDHAARLTQYVGQDSAQWQTVEKLRCQFDAKDAKTGVDLGDIAIAGTVAAVTGAVVAKTFDQQNHEDDLPDLTEDDDGLDFDIESLTHVDDDFSDEGDNLLAELESHDEDSLGFDEQHDGDQDNLAFEPNDGHDVDLSDSQDNDAFLDHLGLDGDSQEPPVDSSMMNDFADKLLANDDDSLDSFDLDATADKTSFDADELGESLDAADLSLDGPDDASISDDLSLDSDSALDGLSLDAGEDTDLDGDDLSLDDSSTQDDLDDLSFDHRNDLPHENQDDLALDHETALDAGALDSLNDLSMDSLFGEDLSDYHNDALDDDSELSHLLSELESSTANLTADINQFDFDNGGDEVDAKFNMVKLYLDMDDYVNARHDLAEILHEGNDEQKQRAQTMLDEIVEKA